jgi:hypothetical protein
VKKHLPTLVVLVSLGGAAASSVFVPHEWRWPAIGSFLFVAIIVAMRQISTAIGQTIEKKFNRDD